jgi:GMP synthase (glutamine-hydrolysing)
MRGSLNRREVLKAMLISSAAMALLDLAACAPRDEPAPIPSPVEVTRVVEETKIVSKIVEVERVVTPVPPSPTPPEEEAMIWYVDIEHPDAVADPNLAPNFDEVRRTRTRVVGDAANQPSESVFYQEVSWELVRERKVKAITISGNTSDWERYDFATFEPLFEIVKSGQIPTIGLCGGHQLIGLMYGMPCDAIRRLKDGETDPGGFAPGWFKEVGYLPVQVLKPEDPLFQDLGEPPVFFESHYWEIKELHPDFELLASTENCRIQAMKHKQYPIYGTQFHPEVNSAEHRDGRKLLVNFFRLAGIRKD